LNQLLIELQYDHSTSHSETSPDKLSPPPSAGRFHTPPKHNTTLSIAAFS